MLIVGQKEAEEGLVAVRSRAGGDEGQSPVQAFIDRLCEEIREKK